MSRQSRILDSKKVRGLAQIEDPNYPHDCQPMVRRTVRRRYHECLTCGHRWRTDTPLLP